MTTEYKLTVEESFEMGQNCQIAGLNEDANPLRNYPATVHNSNCSKAWLDGFAESQSKETNVETV
ncbi:hypothetical protein AB6D11_06220 [Vibrio splendidus]